MESLQRIEQEYLKPNDNVPKPTTERELRELLEKEKQNELIKQREKKN